MKPNPFREINEKKIVKSIQSFAAKYGRPPTKRECKPVNGLPSFETMSRRFRTFNNAIIAAGFQPTLPTRQEDPLYRDEELLRLVKEFSERFGAVPLDNDWEKHKPPGAPGRGTYYRHFNSWLNVLRKSGIRFSITRYIARRFVLFCQARLADMASALKEQIHKE